MNTLVNIKEMQEMAQRWNKQGLSIGFVPTMGYLHNGHISLIEKARAENNKVIVSIFVNPIQFCPGEDFDKYPRDTGHDSKVCAASGVDLLFMPDAAEMYPPDFFTFVDIQQLGNGLCGARRPGHFRGVCTVISKFFNIISPDRAYFGEKDAQQLAIIKRMTTNLNYKTEIVSCPTVREADGLAMSSRNSYLSEEQRKAALVISKSLDMAKNLLTNGERTIAKIKTAIIEAISKEPLANIDYVEAVEPLSLKPIDTVYDSVLVAAAVYIGGIRLIDNFTFKVENL
jgi:pantoate--beta-alanine ligase